MLNSLYPNIENQLDDFKALEQHRFHIMDTFKYTPEQIQDHVNTAIGFCAQTNKNRRNYSFKVNPQVPEFLVQSEFQWYGAGSVDLMKAQGSYLFAPSIMELPPKELALDGLSTLLLDLQHYTESFSYHEFFGLVKNAIGMEDDALDGLLMEFITEHVLYYHTLVPIP